MEPRDCDEQSLASTKVTFGNKDPRLYSLSCDLESLLSEMGNHGATAIARTTTWSKPRCEGTGSIFALLLPKWKQIQFWPKFSVHRQATMNYLWKSRRA